MRYIIKEMYNGDLFPLGTYTHRNDEYRKAIGELVDAEKNLIPISTEVKALFEKNQDAQMQLSYITNCAEFINGVRVGVQIILEMNMPVE